MTEKNRKEQIDENTRFLDPKKSLARRTINFQNVLARAKNGTARAIGRPLR